MAVDTKSVLIGLIGSGIGASLSPAMHEREGDRQRMRYMYKLVDLNQLRLDQNALPDLLLAAQQMNFTGLNITHPCKQSVIPYLDELSEEATEIGAVNTVLFRNNKRIGYNTDGRAFVESFGHQLGDAPHRLVVLAGAGGAGTAIAHSILRSFDTSLVILDEDSRKAESLCEKLIITHGVDKVAVAKNLADVIESADGFINATPVGMELWPGSVLPYHLMREDLWVADIVYYPLETELLKLARSRGCRVMEGGGMAVFQAASAFKIFTGVEADVTRMMQHFQKLVATAISLDKPVQAAVQ